LLLILVLIRGIKTTDIDQYEEIGAVIFPKVCNHPLMLEQAFYESFRARMVRQADGHQGRKKYMVYYQFLSTSFMQFEFRPPPISYLLSPIILISIGAL